MNPGFKYLQVTIGYVVVYRWLKDREEPVVAVIPRDIFRRGETFPAMGFESSLETLQYQVSQIF